MNSCRGPDQISYYSSLLIFFENILNENRKSKTYIINFYPNPPWYNILASLAEKIQHSLNFWFFSSFWDTEHLKPPLSGMVMLKMSMWKFAKLPWNWETYIHADTSVQTHHQRKQEKSEFYKCWRFLSICIINLFILFIKMLIVF